MSKFNKTSNIISYSLKHNKLFYSFPYTIPSYKFFIGSQRNLHLLDYRKNLGQVFTMTS